MRKFLVAIVAHREQDIHEFLLASRLGPDKHPFSKIEEWWVAEDDREDGSDNESAVFIPKSMTQQEATEILR